MSHPVRHARRAAVLGPALMLADALPTAVSGDPRFVQLAAGLDHTCGVATDGSIACPLLALWSSLGPLSSWYAEAGGPLALWRAWGDDVQGRPLNAGHFFPEEIPTETADVLDGFFDA